VFLVDGLSSASFAGRDLAPAAAAAAAHKLEPESDAEDGRGEDGKHQELKSPNLRSNQVEAKDDVGLVSTSLRYVEI